MNECGTGEKRKIESQTTKEEEGKGAVPSETPLPSPDGGLGGRRFIVSEEGGERVPQHNTPKNNPEKKKKRLATVALLTSSSLLLYYRDQARKRFCLMPGPPSKKT